MNFLTNSVLTEPSLSQVRQISTIGQEQWLEEITEQLEKAQNLHLPLKKQLAAQEKLILNCLDPKKVEQFKSRKKDNYEF